MVLVLCCCFGVVSGLGAGCSDDDSTGGNNNVQQDAGADAEPDASTEEPLIFLVQEWSTQDGTYVPLADVAVAYDAQSGVRTESTTGTDGLATFDVIDPTLGESAATFYKTGYVALSFVHLTYEKYLDVLVDGKVPVYLSPLTPPQADMVTVTGDATGLVAPATHPLVIFPHRALGTAYSGNGNASYSFTVEQDAPFSIVAIEAEDGYLPSNRGYWVDIHKAMVAEHDPISASSAVYDLDFDMWEITPQTVDGSIILPTRADSPLRGGWGLVFVKSNTSGDDCLTGWAESIERTADGNRFDVSYIWVEPPLLEGVYTYHLVYDTTTNELSMSNPRGYPEGGVLAVPLLDTPEWITPADPLTPHLITETFEWEWFDDVSESSIVLSRNQTSMWYVIGGQNSTSVTIPELPTGITAAQLLGNTSVARVYGGHIDDLGWVQYSQSMTVRVSP